jgi:alpha-L-fucosidase 2
MKPTVKYISSFVASHTCTVESTFIIAKNEAIPFSKHKFIFTFLLSLFTFHHLLFAQQLWYNQPAKKWTDALPIGNGRIGAMVFAGVETDHIQFNEQSLWTNGPREYNKTDAYKYLPQIRSLINQGKQKEAEALAEQQFMGLKSNEGKKDEWLASVKKGEGIKGNPTLLNYNDEGWKEMKVPAYDGWESIGFEGLDGALWFRKTFTLPDDWNGKDLILDVNKIKDADFTFVNGTLISSSTTANSKKYIIPANILVKGKNVIAIQVINFDGVGGIQGYKDTTKRIGIYPKDAANKLSLNGNWKYFIQNDNPPATAAYQASYQPFGDVYLHFNKTSNYTNYRRSLDISKAIATTTYNVDDVQFKREYFVSAPHQLLAVHLSASKKQQLNFAIELGSAHKNFTVKAIDKNTLQLNVQVKNGALHGESIVKIELKEGTSSIKNNQLVIENATEANIYITAETNFKNYKDVSANAHEKCSKGLNQIKNISYNSILQQHIADYQSYYNTFNINFGKSKYDDVPTDERLKNFATNSDPAFVALYAQYGRYLLISSSRPNTMPANLQGIWNDLLSPPWGSKYTTNINAEMNYWPAELLNLSSLHQSLFKMIEELSIAGQTTAHEYYHARGWVLHHNTDLWRGTAPINASNHGIWVTGGAWLCQHLWEHYLYTNDTVFLQTKAYPIMRSAASFFVDYLVKDSATGWLISSPSNSPEHGGLVAGPTMDHQIIKQLYSNTIAAAKLLHVDAKFSDTLSTQLKQIAPNQIGKYGQLQEWLQDKDDIKDNHRHVSHLWAVYPGNQINWDETPQLMNAAKQSLLYRGDAATGWSLAWKINLWARFKDGNHAYQLIKMLFNTADKGGAGSYNNLFDAHPPFQIDGNFGGAAGIVELLLQSHLGYIDVLPALPDELPEGDVKGICARGGFTINMQWSNHQLQTINITSNAGNNCVVKYAGKQISFKTQKEKTYSLNNNLQMQ